MSDDKPKVFSMQLRRRQQLKEEERLSGEVVTKLADEITKLLGEQQKREVKSFDPADAFVFAVNQILSLEFASNALLAVFERSLGHVMLNSVLVEVARRRHFYKVEWPAHAHDKTFFDHLPKKEKTEAEVVPISKENVESDQDAWEQFVASFKGKLLQPSITEDDWWIVSDVDEDQVYPCSLFTREDMLRMHPSPPASIERKHGWGACLSAPGFLDKTDTVVLDSEQEAKRYLMDTFEDDG